MRQIRYGVAMSLDGYIAGPNGEYDWIINDPDIDFGAIFSRFDTLLMGRKTFAGTTSGDGPGLMEGIRTIVVSRTLRQSDYPDVTIISENVPETVSKLREQPGKDIWLFGGGMLFQTMLEAKLVDGLDMGVIPVLVGGGVPFLPAPARQTRLKLTNHKVYKSGIVMLEYGVEYT